MLPDQPRFVAALRARFVRLAALARAGCFATFAARRAFFALTDFGIPGNSNAGSERGSTCCAMLTAVSAACFTVDSTVLRVSFQTEFAKENGPVCDEQCHCS